MPLIHRTSPYPHWEFSDASSGDQLRVVPERGGLVSGWRCGGRELLYLDQERFLDPALSVRAAYPCSSPSAVAFQATGFPCPRAPSSCPSTASLGICPGSLPPSRMAAVFG